MFSYTGHPLATWTRLSRPLIGDTSKVSSAWQWRMAQPIMPNDRATIRELQKNQWQKVPLDEKMHQSLLAMQLYDFLRVQSKEDIVVDVWARSEDLAHIEQTPVILSFELPPHLAGLAANLLRITATDAKLLRENVQDEDTAILTHHDVGREVRDAVERIHKQSPEDLPRAADLRHELEARRRKSKKIQQKQRQREEDDQDTLF